MATCCANCTSSCLQLTGPSPARLESRSHQDFSIFAMSHRYKDRSVTQLLYKPKHAVHRQLASHARETASEEPSEPEQDVYKRGTEIRALSKDVTLQSARISGTQRQREGNGNEYVTYQVDSVLLVHGVQTTLRSERRYKHFNLLDQLLKKEFGPLVPQALPAKRAFGNLQPSFVEERRVALEKYLQQCVAIPVVAASSAFCNFVEADVGGADSGSSFERSGEEMLTHSLHRVCSKQGYLLKKGRRVASWKRRYFCLCSSELFYYYTAEMSNPFQPLGVISLHESKPEGPAGHAKADASSSAADETSDGASTALPSNARTTSSSSGSFAPLSSSVIIEPHGPTHESLPRLFSFVVHTSSRTYHLAAASQREKDEWVRVLCACGAQLSASSAQGPPPDSLAVPPSVQSAGSSNDGRGGRSASGGVDGGADGGASGGARMRGTLWKRASKVHIAQVRSGQRRLTRLEPAALGTWESDLILFRSNLESDLILAPFELGIWLDSAPPLESDLIRTCAAPR